MAASVALSALVTLSARNWSGRFGRRLSFTSKACGSAANRSPNRPSRLRPFWSPCRLAGRCEPIGSDRSRQGTKVLVAVTACAVLIQDLRWFIQDFLWIRFLDIDATLSSSTGCDVHYRPAIPAPIRKRFRIVAQSSALLRTEITRFVAGNTEFVGLLRKYFVDGEAQLASVEAGLQSTGRIGDRTCN